jgi:peptide/nickel transport system substrate-binding protein
VAVSGWVSIGWTLFPRRDEPWQEDRPSKKEGGNVKRKNVLLAQLISLFVVVVVLAQCGAVPPATTQPVSEATQVVTNTGEAAPTQAVEVTSTQAGQAATGRNVFVYADPDPFPDMDPARSYSSESYALSNCYETLVFYNPPGSAEALSPKLATRWEHNADATEWTFYLQQGVKFQDGEPFDADAVKYSLLKTKEIGVGAAYILDPINEIEVVDDYTVKFKLSYSAPLDVILAAGYGAWIYSPKAYEEKGGTDWFKQGHCVGTGPYTMESYEPGSRLVMTRFDGYWGGWKEGQFDKIVFELVSDPTILQQKIESGDASFTYNVPADNLATLRNNPSITIHQVPSCIVMLCQ